MGRWEKKHPLARPPLFEGFFVGFASSLLKPHWRSEGERRGLSLSGLNQPLFYPTQAVPARILREPRGKQLGLPARGDLRCQWGRECFHPFPQEGWTFVDQMVWTFVSALAEPASSKVMTLYYALVPSSEVMPCDRSYSHTQVVPA